MCSILFSTASSLCKPWGILFHTYLWAYINCFNLFKIFTYGYRIILYFQVKLAIFWQNIQFLHHLVKSGSFLQECELVVIWTEEVLDGHLWGNGHFLSFSEEENFHRYICMLLDVEWYQTLVFLLLIIFKQTANCINVTIEQFSSLVLLQENTRGQLVLVWLNTG